MLRHQFFAVGQTTACTLRQRSAAGQPSADFDSHSHTQMSDTHTHTTLGFCSMALFSRFIQSHLL